MKRRIKTAEVAVVKRELLVKQNWQCMICTTSLTKLPDACLDHDHGTGLIRGVLCRNCNGIEGKVHNLVVRGRRGMAKHDYLGKLILYWMHHLTDRTGLYHPTHKTDDEKRLRANKLARARRAAKKEA